VLHKGEQRSCVAAVSRVVVLLVALGREPCAKNTGAYCRARAKLPEKVIERLAVDVARGCEAQVPQGWLWHQRHVKMIDGTTCSMPDTEENRAAYPQHSAQKEGLGFPLIRIVVALSLATAMLCSAAMGPYSGKETGETALLREVLDQFTPGAAVAGLPDGVLNKGRGVDHIVQTAIQKADESSPAVGDGLGDQFLATGRQFLAKRETGLFADLGEHFQEAIFAGKDRACGCNHLGNLQGLKSPAVGRPCGETQSPRTDRGTTTKNLQRVYPGRFEVVAIPAAGGHHRRIRLARKTAGRVRLGILSARFRFRISRGIAGIRDCEPTHNIFCDQAKESEQVITGLYRWRLRFLRER
jgi:hypothetical protein